MTSRLVLAVVTMTAVFAISQVRAQSTTQTIPPATNTTAKQDKRTLVRPQAAAPKSEPTRAEQKPAAANAKPADAAAAATRQASAGPRVGKDVPRIQPSQLGRVPVDSKGASFGFSSETKMNMYATPDGQRIRGLDHQITSNRQPNYFGLSLSVPTTGNPFGGAPTARD